MTEVLQGTGWILSDFYLIIGGRLCQSAAERETKRLMASYWHELFVLQPDGIVPPCKYDLGSSSKSATWGFKEWTPNFLTKMVLICSSKSVMTVENFSKCVCIMTTPRSTCDRVESTSQKVP